VKKTRGGANLARIVEACRMPTKGLMCAEKDGVKSIKGGAYLARIVEAACGGASFQEDGV